MGGFKAFRLKADRKFAAGLVRIVCSSFCTLTMPIQQMIQGRIQNEHADENFLVLMQESDVTNK